MFRCTAIYQLRAVYFQLSTILSVEGCVRGKIIKHGFGLHVHFYSGYFLLSLPHLLPLPKYSCYTSKIHINSKDTGLLLHYVIWRIQFLLYTRQNEASIHVLRSSNHLYILSGKYCHLYISSAVHSSNSDLAYLARLQANSWLNKKKISVCIDCRQVPKFEKGDYQLRHVCPSTWNNLASAGQTFIKMNICVFFENLLRKCKCH